MAFYDTETAAAAQAALGRPFQNFIGPDDDPTVNSSADAIFLRNRLRDHVNALSTHIKSRYPSARCEVLNPYDVNYPQGGLGDRLKIEALAFGSTMRDLNLAVIAIQFPFTLSWPLGKLRYLMPVFVPCGTWQKELAMAFGRRYPVVNLWAFDQVNIFGLDVLEAANQARSTTFGIS